MYRIFLVFFGINVLLLAGCKENKNDDVVTVSSEVLVDEDGATIVTDDNVVVIIPAGALIKKEKITVTPSDLVVAQLEVYSAVYSLQPANLELQKSAQLLIPLPEENISPDQLQIYRLDANGEHGGGWQPLSSELHTTGRHLRASVAQFGFFVLARRMDTSGETTVVIGTEGGRLTTSSGLVLNIPSGSFSEQNTVVVRSLQVFVTDMQQHSSMYELQPISVSLKMPAQLTIPYDEPAAGSQNLAIFRAGRSDAPVAEWTELLSSTDPAAHTVSANTTQFGFFVVAVQRSTPTDTASDTVTATDTDTVIPADTQTEDSGSDSDSISTPVDFCAESPCVNGTCTNGADGFVCTCETGYSGTICDECATGYQDNDFDGVCDFDCGLTRLDCGVHGTCDDSLGTVQCVCDEGITGAYCDNCAPGYQDNNSDAVCELDCATVGFDCGSNGACSDASGTAMCICDSGYAGAACAVCAPGYQDNDADGLCTETCATAELNCGNQGTCSDAGGTAICICSDGFTGTYCDGCADGYQDRDGNGVCTPACGTADIDCGENGACSDASGTASCVCEAGYDGDSCSQCAVGYQDFDENGTCTPDCTTAALVCGGNNGTCADSSGTARCECLEGYTGSDCADCTAGYQDNNQDGTCEQTCESASLDCGSYGACSDGSGLATCVCGTGYTGTSCSDCIAGYQDNDSNGSCLLTCASTNLDCGSNGECSDASGNAICSCSTGYDGAACDVCASGYQDNDEDGVCNPDCTGTDLNCGNNGTCSDTTGAAMCICDTGYNGETCAACAPGYQDNDGDGVCSATCEIAGLNCGNGTCVDSSGAAMCSCSAGYEGADCTVCATGYQDNNQDGTCELTCGSANLNCGSYGACSDSSGSAMCICGTGYTGPDCSVCATGYQDNDNNGSCLLTCDSTNLNCSGNGECSDTSGNAMCSCDTGYDGATCAVCAAGYQDNDGDDVCAPDCTSANLNCGNNGTCSDTTGAAMCICDTGYDGETCAACAPGYQDNDQNGVCNMTCTSSQLNCGDFGDCSDQAGTPVCVCDEGVTGTYCDNCADGYQDNDQDGECSPDCATSGLNCGANGSCADTSGAAICVCQTGYDGLSCDTCATGYQDNNNNGSCVPTCATSGLNCGDFGTCSDNSGTAACVCDEGYTGSSCNSCSAGYQDFDNNGTCELSCSGAELSCGSFGQCDDTTGTAACVCDDGYDGASCNVCAAGYQDNDNSGTCEPECATSGLNCGSNGACADTTGVAICACDTGYTGATCNLCATGYQDNDNSGTCAPDCATSGLNCGANGACADTSGAAICECRTGYDGPSCDTCATGYQDNDDNGSCVPTCATSGLNCGDFGTCSDNSGAAACVCDEGYTGSSCNSCSIGYQDFDNNGTCELTCAGAGLSCGVFGQCDDTGGTAACVCDTGYDGETCNVCASGYQDNDNSGTCEPDCATSGLNCGSNGACADTSGVAICACDTGYTGAACDVCASGYQDNDDNGTCASNCATSGLNCGQFGACSDATGEALCACDTGYTGAACDACALGYQDNDDNGTCVPNCATSGLNCGEFGTCSDNSGVARCACDIGYTGAACDACATGYQDNDQDGVCAPDCATSGLNCGSNGSCSDTSGAATCMCATGYDGPTCDACATGYQDNDFNFICEESCTISTLSCNEHGSCNDTSGTPECACEAGYAGNNCELCASGYQDNDRDGLCSWDCTMADLTCSDRGSCSDTSGTAICVCDEGYDGQDCELCDDGYVRNPVDESCNPGCELLSLACSNHGYCNDADGFAECICDEGYVGDACDGCNDGYIPQDDGSCLPGCAVANLDCNNHGVCDDNSGVVACVCDKAYVGTYCDQCAAGFQDNDGDGECNPTCATANFVCGKYQVCSDSSGLARCVGDGICGGETIDISNFVPGGDSGVGVRRTTAGATDALVESDNFWCWKTYSTSEQIFHFTPPATMYLRIFTSESDYDAMVSVLDNCPTPDGCWFSDDEHVATLESEVPCQQYAVGRTYSAVVSGFQSESGMFTLNVQQCDPKALEPPECAPYEIQMDAGCVPVPENCRNEVVEFKDPALNQAVHDALEIGTTKDVYIWDVFYQNVLSVDGGALKERIVSLEGLECFQNLTGLYLPNHDIIDVGAIGKLTQLDQLDLSGNQISDITPLGKLRALTFLNLRDNMVSNVRPLQGMTGMSQLDVANNQISDIYPLRFMTLLKSLDLSGNPIEKLSPLSSIQSIEFLTVSNTLIQTLNGLENMTALQRLEAGDCQISTPDAIARTGRLLQLTLSNNKLETLDMLAGLVNLTLLKVDGNNITDLSPLAKMSRLTELWISNNQIESVDSLASLFNLLTLEAGNNLISNFIPLTEATKLTTLNLENNKLTNVKGINTFGALSSLDISGNGIQYIEELASLTGLNRIDLSNNVIADILPLVTNQGIGGNDVLHIEVNAYDCKDPTTLEYIINLNSRLSEFTHDCGVLR